MTTTFVQYLMISDDLYEHILHFHSLRQLQMLVRLVFLLQLDHLGWVVQEQSVLVVDLRVTLL